MFIADFGARFITGASTSVAGAAAGAAAGAGASLLKFPLGAGLGTSSFFQGFPYMYL